MKWDRLTELREDAPNFADWGDDIAREVLDAVTCEEYLRRVVSAAVGHAMSLEVGDADGARRLIDRAMSDLVGVPA